MDSKSSIPYSDKKRNRKSRFLRTFYNFCPNSGPPPRPAVRFFTPLHPQALGDQAALVGFDKGFQVPHPLLLAYPFVGVRYLDTPGRRVDILTLAGNILVLVDGFLHTLKGLVGAQDEPPGIVHQRVARNAGFW